MDAVTLKNQLNSHIASMFAAGLVGEQFRELLMLQEDSPGFVAEVAGLFVDDAKKIIDQIAGLLSEQQPVVDFDKVDGLVHQFKGSSGSIGALKVKLMCEHCRQFLDAKNREGCLMVLDIIRNEFIDISSKFHTMFQLEQQIEACS